MTVYVVMTNYPQESFADEHGETADPRSELSGVFLSETKARERQYSIINNSDENVDVTLDEMEVIV